VRGYMIACPIDFSDCSKRALRYAGALASHLRATLDLIHVVDPLLAGAAAVQQLDVLGDEARAELRAFAEAEIVLPAASALTIVRGSPDQEIVNYASRQRADVIVMGTHGLTGVRKAFFGSTAQGVLRKSPVPVLAVPLSGSGRADLDTPLVGSGPVLAPVDFSRESDAAAHLAAGLARALSVPLVLLHVTPARREVLEGWQHARNTWGDRTPAAVSPESLLQQLTRSLDYHRSETSVLEGVPAEEIARCARDREANVIVMSLSGAGTGARPGSVAYRVLCLAPVPVLAIPPATVPIANRESSRASHQLFVSRRPIPIYVVSDRLNFSIR
jgi:universal stress protein A